MKTSFKSDIVKNYVKKFPKSASHSLARKIYIENIELFKDIEDARASIRYIRGIRGKASRKKPSSLHVKPHSLGNPYKLPSSDARKAKVLKLPAECDNILFISDLHVPYHDVHALTLAFKYGLEHDVNCIFINGDLMDFFQISRFVKLNRKRSVKEELNTAREILGTINRLFPNVPIYFLLGNHDLRLQMYLSEKAPELLDMEEFRLEILLRAKKHNMQVIPDTTLVKVGSLAVTHGHLLLKGVFAPVNAARGAFLRAKASTIISHVHKVSTHSETNINGKVITTYSTGCLCELNPEYNPFANNYSHGFAHIVLDKTYYKVRNLQIVNGELLA